MTGFGRQAWGPEEDELLRASFPVMPYAELKAKFPRRTWRSVAHRALRLGLKRQVGNWEKPVESLRLGGFDLGFVVGLLEGEGTITCHPSGKGDLCPQVFWTNTAWDLLYEVQNLLNGWGTIRLKKGEAPRQPCYRYVIEKYAEVEEVLKAVQPFLVTKKRQAQIVLRLLELQKGRPRHGRWGHKHPPFPEERHQLVAEIRALQGRAGVRKEP